MSVPARNLALANPLFCTAFMGFAYFLCGVGHAAQFRLPGALGHRYNPGPRGVLV